MHRVKLQITILKFGFIAIAGGLASENVLADYDCVKLDPRVKLSEQTEVEVSGNAETVYKIAKAGGKVAVEAKSAAQNIQESVPMSEAGNAQNRLLYLLCEMMSKDDIPTDKKIELYKYVTDKIAPGATYPSTSENSKSTVDTPKKPESSLTNPTPQKPSVPKANESTVKKVISDPNLKIDIYNGAESKNSTSKVPPNSLDSGTGGKSIIGGGKERAQILTFNDDCKQELGFQYAKYKQTEVGAKYPYYFIYVRNNKDFQCDECVEKLAKFIESKTDIPVIAGGGTYGNPGCIGYRESMGANLKGAQCLQALLGENYKVDKANCSMDGLPYPVKLRK